jgi:hypothetical protein
MADLTGCNSCYNVKLPACFDLLVATLEPSTTYDAVFTNHFGKKKIIEVSTEADGSLEIGVDEFPPGYFTSFNTVMLEFFQRSSGGGGGYYGDYGGASSVQDDCKAATVCEA